MKVLAFIFSLVVATALILGGTVLIFVPSPRHSILVRDEWHHAAYCMGGCDGQSAGPPNGWMM